MQDKHAVGDYTELEFKAFVQEILNQAKEKDPRMLYALLEHFSKIVGHPDRRNLIVACPDSEYSADVITEKVKAWHSENNKPCFKDR
jgi:hypothetical protein